MATQVPGSALAALLGFLSMAALYVVRRLVDYYLPKGRMSRWAATHTVPVELPDAEDEEG